MLLQIFQPILSHNSKAKRLCFYVSGVHGFGPAGQTNDMGLVHRPNQAHNASVHVEFGSEGLTPLQPDQDWSPGLCTALCASSSTWAKSHWAPNKSVGSCAG